MLFSSDAKLAELSHFAGRHLAIASTIEGARTAAVIISVRPKDFSNRILVFLPYTPKSENLPTVLRTPQVDFPAESVSLMPKQDLVLTNVLRGRESHPLSK